MAALTWREVAAPDLSTSLRGYEQFNRTLQDSLGGLRETATDIDKDITDRASQALILQALQAQDPDAVRKLAAVADPKRINAQAIAMLGARPGQILGEQNAQLALDEGKHGFAKEKAGDALAPTFIQASELARSGNVAGAQALYEANKDQFAAAGLKTSQAFTKALQESEEFGVDITGKKQSQVLDLKKDQRDQTRLDMDVGRYNFEKEDREDGKAAEGYLASVMESVDPNNIESVRNAVFNGGLSRAKGSVKAAVYGRLSQLYPGLFNPDQFGVGVASSNGGVDAPATDYTSFMRTLESGGKANAVNPRSSATGADQFTEKTWLQTVRVADPGWAKGMSRQQILDARRDPVKSAQMENRLRTENIGILSKSGLPATNANVYAMHHFGADRGAAFAKASGDTPISQILTPAQIAANPYVQGKTKAQVLANWDNRTGGGGSTPAVMMGAALRQGQDRAGRSSASELIGASSGPTNPLDVVESLRTSDRFKGTSKEFLTGEIKAIMDKSRVNGQPTITAAQAGVILRDATRVNNNSWDITNWLGNNSVRINKAGDRIDRTYVDQEIERAKGGGLVQSATREVDTGTSLARLQAAQAAADRANAAYVSAQRRVITQPALRSQLPLLQASAAAANRALQNVRSETERLNAPVQKPVAKSTGKPSGGFFSDLFTIRRGG